MMNYNFVHEENVQRTVREHAWTNALVQTEVLFDALV